jgi:hypothetical protein
MYTSVHVAIHADPTAQTTENRPPSEKKMWVISLDYCLILWYVAIRSIPCDKMTTTTFCPLPCLISWWSPFFGVSNLSIVPSRTR